MQWVSAQLYPDRGLLLDFITIRRVYFPRITEWIITSMSKSMTRLRIATRESQLALCQAEQVKALLLQHYPTLEVSLVALTTEGDRRLEVSLQKIGGKGLFVKELETSLLNNNADIAVHSAKDVPMDLPTGLTLTTFLPRVDPRDAFLSTHYSHFEALPAGASVGTSSLRRMCQLHALRPDLQFRLLRGNVPSRITKLDAGEYDAIILAAAGLKRLGLSERITELLPLEVCLPACGQGVIAIEARSNQPELADLLAPLNCEKTKLVTLAERAMNKALGGNCSVPIAAYAEWRQEQLWLRGLVGSPDGTAMLRAEHEADPSEYQALGEYVASQLIAQGAEKIIHDTLHAEK